MNGIHVSKMICMTNFNCQKQKHKLHLYKYYDALKHKYLWVNGSLMNHNEEVLPTLTSIEFGIDNTGYGPFIKDRLQYVRHDVKWKCE
jgi:hypothetical protein